MGFYSFKNCIYYVLIHPAKSSGTFLPQNESKCPLAYLKSLKLTSSTSWTELSKSMAGRGFQCVFSASLFWNECHYCSEKNETIFKNHLISWVSGWLRKKPSAFPSVLLTTCPSVDWQIFWVTWIFICSGFDLYPQLGFSWQEQYLLLVFILVS